MTALRPEAIWSDMTSAFTSQSSADASFDRTGVRPDANGIGSTRRQAVRHVIMADTVWPRAQYTQGQDIRSPAQEMFDLTSALVTVMAVSIREGGQHGSVYGSDQAFYTVLLFGFLGMSALGRLSAPWLSRPWVLATTLVLAGTPASLYGLSSGLRHENCGAICTQILWDCLGVATILLIGGCLKFRCEPTHWPLDRARAGQIDRPVTRASASMRSAGMIGLARKTSIWVAASRSRWSDTTL